MYKVELYARVRRACMVEGMSTREAARVFGLHRDTVRKMLQYSVPPGYRRESPPRVDGQRKCPAKWPAKMSLVLLAMITDGSYSTRSRFMGGLRASMYFFAVSRWMPSSRATPRVDNPLRFAF